MRSLFRRIGARTGISLGLILGVAAVLVVAKLADDGRPAAAPAARVGSRCLTHGMDTACPLCIQRVTAAEPVGASASQ